MDSKAWNNLTNQEKELYKTLMKQIIGHGKNNFYNTIIIS